MTQCVIKRLTNRDKRPVYIRDNVEYSVDGVFDEEHDQVLLADETPITSHSLQLSIYAGSIPFTPGKGDKIRIGAREFRIVEAQPDAEMEIVLKLRKA
jgi:hypothetical protein